MYRKDTLILVQRLGYWQLDPSWGTLALDQDRRYVWGMALAEATVIPARVLTVQLFVRPCVAILCKYPQPPD